jgi:N-acetylmuramoyl-L-alanine amidase
MRGYYAFNWRRYDHSLHPMTVAMIIETGFLTNVSDRRLIVNNHKKSAQGIANGILKYLNTLFTTEPGIAQ